MLFEIKNPSDPYTIEGEFLYCVLAVTLVGAGRMALSPLRPFPAGREQEVSMPLFFFGGHDEWFMERFGWKVEDAPISENIDGITRAMAGVLYGDASDRELLALRLREVQGDEARDKYLNDWENDRQSSLVPIGANYRKSAESLRRKYNLPRVWPADLIESFVPRAAEGAASA